ncbi:MAG TPA: hypothetical protein VF768_03365, partial [Holophagaceae bacterium]
MLLVGGPDHPTVTLPLTPQASTPVQINPTQPASPANTYFYDYSVVDGDSLTDAIPIQIGLSTQSGTWNSVKVHFNAPAGNLPGVSVPEDTWVVPEFACTTVYLSLATGPLVLSNPAVPSTFQANLQIQPADKNPNTLTITNASEFPTIHIRVTVRPAENDTAFFMTDSSGNLLADCSGAYVTASGSQDGRFAINVNPKKGL